MGISSIIDRIHQFLTADKLFVIIFILVGFSSGIYTLIQPMTNSTETSNNMYITNPVDVIATINQNGSNTIINTKPIPRHISQNFIIDLNKNLPLDKNTSILITKLNDNEAIQFGDEIVNYLTSNGWTRISSRTNTRIPAPSPGIHIYKLGEGLEIYVSSNPNS
jgi:hypothetical protein